MFSIRFRQLLAFFATVALGLGLASRAQALSASLTWNSAGTDWNTSSNWSPNGVPTAFNAAFFTPDGASPLTPVNNPNLSAASSALSLTIAPNQQLGGWTFTGAQTLTIGGTGSTGLTTYGPASYTFNGPLLQGAAPTSTLTFTVTTGSTLTLTGASSAVTNIGGVQIFGGTFIVDNTNTTNTYLSATAPISIQSGTFQINGNTASPIAPSFGTFALAATSSGVNAIQINNNGQPVTATIAGLGPSATNSRSGTFNVFDFVATSGTFGGAGASDPKIIITATPTTVSTPGLICGTATQWGFAIIQDASGNNWAKYGGSNGIVAATYTKTGATSATANFSTSTASDITSYTPGTGTDSYAGAAFTTGALTIAPTASGGTLSFTNAAAIFSSAGVMLSTPANSNVTFTITGGSGTVYGTAASSSTKYVYVTDATSTLTISMPFSNTNPINFVGPGFVDVSGGGIAALTLLTNRIDILGGTFRVTPAQVNATNLKTPIAFYGGVLEIVGGANGTGASADFTATLGTATANIYWSKSGSAGGSGGFSAIGTAASVSIGGATPTPLQWGLAAASTSFLLDGYSLIFGSTKSNAVLTFYNPVQLDNGTTTYQLRTIQVIGGAGGDATNMAGVISGTSSADLIKTGTGTLIFSANNTYAGTTFVQQGKLLANNSTSSTGTGNVTVGSGGTLGGTGTIAPNVGNAVTVLSGGRLAPGASIGTLTVAAPVTMVTGSTFAWSLNNTVPTAGPRYSGNSNSAGLQSQLTITGSTNTLAAGNITFKILELTPTTLSFGNSYSWLVASSAGTPTLGTVTFDTSSAPDFAVQTTANGGNMAFEISGSNVYLDLTAVPEPSLLFAGTALLLGINRLRRRMIV